MRRLLSAVVVAGSLLIDGGESSHAQNVFAPTQPPDGVAATCGFYVRETEAAGDEFISNQRMGQLQDWAIGYVSGVASRAPERNLLVGVSVSDLFDWLKSYCAEHPLDDFSFALDRLVDALGEKNQER